MSNYTKLTDFASKDALPSGNAGKIVKGTEIDDEFEAIETAVNSKADLASPTLTGTPAAPTATVGTDTTQIATTAFVQDAVEKAGFVGTTQLAADAVTGAKIADDAVDTEHLANDSIQTDHLDLAAEGALGQPLIKMGAGGGFGYGTIGSTGLTDNAVTSAKIADNAVTADELNVSGDGTSGQVLQSDGDGSFSWVDNNSVTLLTNGAGDVSSGTTALAAGTWIFSSTGGVVNDESGATYNISIDGISRYSVARGATGKAYTFAVHTSSSSFNVVVTANNTSGFKAYAVKIA